MERNDRRVLDVKCWESERETAELLVARSCYSSIFQTTLIYIVKRNNDSISIFALFSDNSHYRNLKKNITVMW